MPLRRICIVTPGYLSSTPRVVREADALSAAGYDVRVAFTQGQLESHRAFDTALAAGRPWRTSVYHWSDQHPGERWAFLRTGVRHRLAQAAPMSALPIAGVAERAEGRIYPELRRIAAAEPADLFIGHYPVGLAAASHAARRYGARLGYDVEDLYSETFAEGPGWAKPKARILRLETRYVPDCAHITAVSRPVAAAFAERFGRAAVPIHNCHPWTDRDRADGAVRERRGEAMSLFWFSQTVGLDRGLQDAIRAVGLMRSPAQVHLRGAVDDHTRAALAGLASSCGVAGSLHFHPPCSPDELLSRAMEHDVGLALETEASLNRRLTVTNKLFLYLTAGLAVAATDLPGQRDVLSTCAEAGELHAPGRVEQLAAHLDEWARDPARLRRARAAALEAARTRWNAEAEGRRLVESVAALDRSHAIASGE
jgi:glycosyltransferase involved in cell wall biosynthesis